MRPSTFLMLALSSVTFAQPTVRPRDGDNKNDNDKYDWAPALEKYYRAVGKHVAEIRTTKGPVSNILSTCDLTRAVQPAAPSPLPVPAAGLTLAHVALGRGTQNYTCKGKAPADAPSAIGAKASLYNATCISATYPDLLAMGPTAALQFPYPTSDKSSLPPSNLALSGHHFFTDLTTPAFNLDTKANDLGFVYSKKLTATPAPPLEDGQTAIGYGNVPWLLLESKAGTIGSIQQIYRLNTAGGSPPPNCADQADFFEQQYAAEYWFYS